MNEPRLKSAHKHASKNRAALAADGECACFFCLSAFGASDITEWTYAGQTALCPKCGIDAVLPVNVDAVDPDFLREMHSYWFERTVRLAPEDDLPRPP